MANEVDAIIARFGQHNVSDAECGKLVNAAIKSGAEPEDIAKVVQMAYSKMGNKEIIYDPKEIKAESKEEVSPKERIARARARKKDHNIENFQPKKKSKDVMDKGSKKAVKAAEKAAKKAEKEAEKAAKKAAKEAKKSKKGLTDIKKGMDQNRDKFNKNEKELDKLKKKNDKSDKNDKKDKDGKSTDGKPMNKLDKPDLSKYGIKEVGKDYVMPVTDQNGKKVEIPVNDEVNQLKSICNKIDEANKVIEQHNESTGKPNVSVDPKTDVAGKDVKAPDGTSAAVEAPAVTNVTPEMADAVKRDACMAALSEIKAPDGITPKFSEEEMKKLTDAAMAMANGDKLSKGLEEKKNEEEKTDHGEKPQSLATPTMRVEGR